MADEESRVSRFLSALGRPFRRRTTPQPQMPLYTTGIQEPVLAQGITIPALFAVSRENLILRTVLAKITTGDIQERILLGEEVRGQVHRVR